MLVYLYYCTGLMSNNKIFWYLIIVHSSFLHVLLTLSGMSLNSQGSYVLMLKYSFDSPDFYMDKLCYFVFTIYKFHYHLMAINIYFPEL